MKKNLKKQPIKTNDASFSPQPAPIHNSGPLLLFSVILSALLVLNLAAASHLRNQVFQTPVTLWEDAASKSVNKRRTHENYGQALSTAASQLGLNQQAAARGLLDKALNEFKTVLALENDNSVPMRDLYREIGVVYFRMGRIDDSITAWQTGLKHEPYDPSLLNNLSVAFIQKQRFDEAERTIRQALMGSPNMPQALNSLGEILMMKGKYEEALGCFLKAIQVSPHGTTRYWNAAIAFEKTGRYDKAIEFAEQYAGMERIPDRRQHALEYIQHLRNKYLK